MFAHNPSLPGLKMRGQQEAARRRAVIDAQLAEAARRDDILQEEWENLKPPPGC